MAKQQLYRSNIRPGCQQVSGKAMAQTLNARVLVNLSALNRLLEGPLNRGIRRMPADLAAIVSPGP